MDMGTNVGGSIGENARLMVCYTVPLTLQLRSGGLPSQPKCCVAILPWGGIPAHGGVDGRGEALLRKIHCFFFPIEFRLWLQRAVSGRKNVRPR